MRQFIQRTWFATAVFAAMCSAYVAQNDSQCGPLHTVGIPVTGLVLVPVIWWWLVARTERGRSGRGAAAGALCVVLTMNLAPILGTIWWEHAQRADQVGAAMGRLEVMLMLFFSVSVGGPIGCLVGALLATLENRWWPHPAARRALPVDEAHHRGSDGALAGAVIATFAGLVGAAIALSFATSPDLGDVLMTIGMIWLLMIPPGAALGAVAPVLWRWIGSARRVMSSSLR